VNQAVLPRIWMQQYHLFALFVGGGHSAHCAGLRQKDSRVPYSVSISLLFVIIRVARFIGSSDRVTYSGVRSHGYNAMLNFVSLGWTFRF